MNTINAVFDLIIYERVSHPVKIKRVSVDILADPCIGCKMIVMNCELCVKSRKEKYHD